MQFAVVLSALFAVFMMTAGVLGLVAPGLLVAVVDPFIKPGLLWIAVVARVVIALVFWLASPLSHAPVVMQVLAVLMFVSAGVILIVGFERIAVFAQWWLARPVWVTRVMAFIGIVFGALVLWTLYR